MRPPLRGRKHQNRKQPLSTVLYRRRQRELLCTSYISFVFNYGRPYGQAIIYCSCGYYLLLSCYGRPMQYGRPLYFHPVVSFFLSISLYLFPRLISAAAEWMSTIL